MDDNGVKIINTKKGLLAISPMIFFVVFYVIASLFAGDFSKVSLPIVFLLSSVYGICITRGKSLPDRVRVFTRGAAVPKIFFIIILFFFIGIFAECAKDIGCFDETVKLTLSILPSNYIFSGLFLAACLVSMATGSAFGTVATLVPIGIQLAEAVGADVSFSTAIVVGGAFFGDNLSFISDTTIAATSTQDCSLKDKFFVNVRIVWPVAVLLLVVYSFLGKDLSSVALPGEINYFKIVPYAVVLILAICGVDVLITLSSGIVLAVVIGLIYGSFDFFGCMSVMQRGLYSLQDVCVITLLASGMMGLIKENGGLDFLLESMRKVMNSKRGAEFGIGALVVVASICTAVNTVAIITVGGIAKELSEKYKLDSRKVASILDTFSCVVQGLLPYGAHVLVGASLAGVSPFELIPYLYYPMLVGVAAVISIAFRLPRKYS